jgi:hypothetical protein
LLAAYTDDPFVSLQLGCPAEVVKHIYMEGADRVYLERGPDGKPAAARKRHHKSDGLIFAPNRCISGVSMTMHYTSHDMALLPKPKT